MLVKCRKFFTFAELFFLVVQTLLELRSQISTFWKNQYNQLDRAKYTTKKCKDNSTTKHYSTIACNSQQVKVEQSFLVKIQKQLKLHMWIVWSHHNEEDLTTGITSTPVWDLSLLQNHSWMIILSFDAFVQFIRIPLLRPYKYIWFIFHLNNLEIYFYCYEIESSNTLKNELYCVLHYQLWESN